MTKIFTEFCFCVKCHKISKCSDSAPQWGLIYRISKQSSAQRTGLSKFYWRDG
jgi:hypothetical protein